MDRYTKAVLTAIAVALCVLAVQNAMPLHAASAFSARCGESFNPCVLELRVSGFLR